MFDFTAPEITTFSYLLWGSMGVAICIASAILLIRSFMNSTILTRAGKLLLFSISIAWAGEAFDKIRFGMWCYGKGPAETWTCDSDIVWMFALTSIIGGLIMFQILTKAYFGNKSWMIGLGTIIITTMISFAIYLRQF